MTVANRLIVAVLALAVTALGVVTVVEVVIAMLSWPGWVIDRATVGQSLQELDWSDPIVLAVAGGVLVVGLLLLVAQVKPRRRAAYPAASDRDDRHVEYDRHGLQRFAAQVAQGHGDVAGADATLRRRVLRVHADVYTDGDIDAARRELAEQVRDRIGQLRLRRAPRVSVRAITIGRRVR